MMQDPKPLFVVGCPRSGTTALGLFLAQHKHVVMGVERFGHRHFPANFSLKPDLFKPERFGDFRAGDTFYDSFDFAPTYYAGVEEKFMTASWVGDKIPTLYQSLPKLFDRFDDQTRVVFIFRNIFDVVASYKARHADPDDDWDKGTDSAIADWTSAIDAYLTSEYQDRIIPIIYEDFFRDPRIGAALLERLGLELDENSKSSLSHRFAGSKRLEAGRKRDLTMDDVMQISINAPFEGYREIVKQTREMYSVNNLRKPNAQNN